jgi:hypothetical protein
MRTRTTWLILGVAGLAVALSVVANGDHRTALFGRPASGPPVTSRQGS